MALPRNQITTVAQAADYAYASYNAAKGGVCPSAAAVYLELYNQLKSGAFGTGELVGGLQVAWETALNTADSYCRGAVDYSKATAQVTAPEFIIDKIPVATAGMGSSWWIWLLGGGLLFLLFGKKGKK